MHTAKKIPKSRTQNKTPFENQRDDFTSRSSSASLVSSSQMSSQIWHSLDMKEKVIGYSNTSGIRNGSGGGTSGISSLNASSESFNPPITQAIIPPDHQSTRNVVSTLPTEQQQRDSSIQIITETVINSTKASTTSVVQSKSVTKKKELLEMSPRDYSPPEPNYVCFGCNVVGEHWRAFCPVRPLKGSLPPKARMLMLAAGAPQPSLNQPLPTRDTNGQERFPPSPPPPPPPPPPFSSFRTQSASGLPTPFSMQSQDSVLNNINLGLNLSSDAPSIPTASTNRDRDDPLLIDLGLGYIANDSTKTVKVNELLPTVATVPQAQTLSPSLSASSSFFQSKEQVSQQQSSVSSTPTASMSLPASGMWSDTSASSSLFSANSISISSSSSPEQHRTDNNSSSANRSLIPSLPIPTSLSNSVQSLSDKLNWISNGVRFIV
jgi:hypothetical protein